jgi:archaemetzincin
VNIYRADKRLIFLLLFAALVACSPQNANQSNSAQSANETDIRPKELVAAMDAVKPFFEPMRPPGPNDWLASFNEPGQTFQEYLNSNPTLPTKERNTIYVLPLGSFTDDQNKVIDITSGYLEAFFGLSVKRLPVEKIKRPLRRNDSRMNTYFHHEQIRTGYIIDELLPPMLPSDGAALIAFTNEDLYPDETMNYVFGQASMENRVGAWSLYWLNSRGTDFDTFLRRTIKVAAHETGHMFSMHHCTKYNCVMSGSNQLDETDYQPIDACPECMAKICWFTHVSPADRYHRLAEFCRQNGMNKEADEFEKKYSAVKDLNK